MGAHEDNPGFVNLRTVVATRTRRLLIWCGAGLSASAGIPTWLALQRRLEGTLSNKLVTLDVPESQRSSRIRAIKQESNPWVAFHRLQQELGIASFRESVKHALSSAASVDIPEIYYALWKLKPYGVVSLNLDRLVARAGVEAGVRGLIEFKGREVASYAYTLNTPRPFVCHIHGIEEDVDSWVFSQPELKRLTDDSTYQDYIRGALISSTVLFLGITADDVAVGGHLERLRASGMKANTHYWITDRRDSATDSWAEQNGIIPIRYKPSSIEHPELVDMLNSLASYVQPEAAPQSPVALDLDLFSSKRINPADLARENPEVIRSELNAYASKILKDGGGEMIERFNSLSKEYDRAIHAAWYISTEPGDNLFLGYRLESEIAKGAFGAVYRAYDDEGNCYAIKVLHAEIRKEKELLNAFRRGVRSMRMLGDEGIDGMVRYRAASEFPATLVMDWVEGPNLNQVVEAGALDDWGGLWRFRCSCQ